jgi:hypothetical protein
MRPAHQDSTLPLFQRSQRDAEGWDCCARLSKTEAERLLDWLEAHGYAQREVSYEDEQGFTVRWRK